MTDMEFLLAVESIGSWIDWGFVIFAIACIPPFIIVNSIYHLVFDEWDRETDGRWLKRGDG